MKITDRDKHRSKVKDLQPLDVFKFNDMLCMVSHSYDKWIYTNLYTGESKMIDDRIGEEVVDVYTDVEIIVGGSYI